MHFFHIKTFDFLTCMCHKNVATEVPNTLQKKRRGFHTRASGVRRKYQFYPLLRVPQQLERLYVYCSRVTLANHVFELEIVHSRRVLLLSFFHWKQNAYNSLCLVFRFGAKEWACEHEIILCVFSIPIVQNGYVCASVCVCVLACMKNIITVLFK